MSSNTDFALRFPETDLITWAGRNPGDPTELQQIGANAQSIGYLSRSDFLTVCKRKSARTRLLCESNSTELIEEATNISFRSNNEEIRIRALMILNGVNWPTASFILHFCHVDRYPILDFRALWSLSIEKIPIYNHQFWIKYVDFCRALGERNRMSMREIDAALWQYSDEHQRTIY